MRFFTSALAAAPALGCSLLVGLTSAQSCISSTIEFISEQSSATDFAEYEFCSGTTLTIGATDTVLNVPIPPFVLFNPKVLIKCGATGERSEECVIKGASDADQMLPSVYFTHWSRSEIPENWPLGDAPDRPDLDPVDVEFQGFTFDGGNLFAASDVPAGVTFKDCAFINGAATDTAFYLSNQPEPTEPPSSVLITATGTPTITPTMALTSPPTGPDNATMTAEPTPPPNNATATAAPTIFTTGRPTATVMPTASPVFASPTLTAMPTAPTSAPLGENQCDAENPCPDPLFPCCSQYNFCGSTPGHCGEGCKSGCNATFPTGAPVASQNATAAPVVSSSTAPTAAPVASSNTTAPVPPARRRWLGYLPNGAFRVSYPIAGPEVARRGGRRTQDTLASFTFERCKFEKNTITVADDYASLMVAESAKIVLKECSFAENTFTHSQGEIEDRKPITALVATGSAPLEISKSCFTKNEQVAALVAIEPSPGDAPPINKENHESENTFLPPDPVPECKGIFVVENYETLAGTCEEFTESTCLVTEPTPKPTASPVEDTTEPTAAPAEGADEPTAEPTAPTPLAADTRSAAAGDFISSLAAAAISVLLFALA